LYVACSANIFVLWHVGVSYRKVGAGGILRVLRNLTTTHEDQKIY